MKCEDCLLFDCVNSTCTATGDAESPSSDACEEFKPITYNDDAAQLLLF